jgi:hypothetical protein
MLKFCDGFNCGHLFIYQYNSLVNPGNQVSPIEFYISKTRIQIATDVYYSYKSIIDENTLIM